MVFGNDTHISDSPDLVRTLLAQIDWLTQTYAKPLRADRIVIFIINLSE